MRRRRDRPERVCQHPRRVPLPSLRAACPSRRCVPRRDGLRCRSVARRALAASLLAAALGVAAFTIWRVEALPDPGDRRASAVDFVDLCTDRGVLHHQDSLDVCFQLVAEASTWSPAAVGELRNRYATSGAFALVVLLATALFVRPRQNG